MWTVKVYTVYNTEEKFEVKNENTAREYAKRIITEGLWYFSQPEENKQEQTFLPVHQIVKVKVYPS